MTARRHVSPQHAVAPAVLRHRLKLTADLEIEGYRPDDILGDILENVEAPRM